jgi:small subunit ribosomal protein S17e
MGKSVPKGIKSKANIILKEMPDSFSEKFEQNKKVVTELKFPFSKWTTNVMSGFITRHKRKQAKALLKEQEAKQKKDVAMKEAADMKKEWKAKEKKETAAETPTAEVAQ